MMTEKRFYIDTIDGGESVLTDNGKELSLYGTCNLLNELNDENKELKEINQDNQDYISSLEEEKINLQIKLQKIRDYVMEDGEVKQGVIEKVMWND